MPPINHRLLRLAREARGWPQKRLADESGIAQGSISKYEKDLMAPSDAHLVQLAVALGYPPAFFEQLETRPAAVLYRTRSLRSAKLEAQVRARLNLARLIVARLLEDISVDFVARFPEPDQSYPTPEAAATRLREGWGVPPGPVESVSDYVEAAAGVVVRADLGTDQAIAAYLHPLGDHQRWFVINTRVGAADRIRFSLAHELGHAVMHEISVAPDTREAEQHANRFAGAFLLPPQDLLAELPRRSLQLGDLLTLKRRFGVSMQSVAMCAHQAGAISRTELERLYRELSYRGWRTEEPGEVPMEQPTILREALAIHRDEHGLTDDELASIANVNVGTLADLLPEHFRLPEGPRLRIVSGR
jgi:Zn-dependent peptidase ImmA (M78 family)